MKHRSMLLYRYYKVLLYGHILLLFITGEKNSYGINYEKRKKNHEEKQHFGMWVCVWLHCPCRYLPSVNKGISFRVREGSCRDLKTFVDKDFSHTETN